MKYSVTMSYIKEFSEGKKGFAIGILIVEKSIVWKSEN
jgi:hypothetical protein